MLRLQPTHSPANWRGVLAGAIRGCAQDAADQLTMFLPTNQMPKILILQFVWMRSCFEQRGGCLLFLV